MPSLVILGFCQWTADAVDTETIRASLGRVAFILAMFVLATLAFFVLRPGGIVMRALTKRSPAIYLFDRNTCGCQLPLWRH